MRASRLVSFFAWPSPSPLAASISRRASTSAHCPRHRAPRQARRIGEHGRTAAGREAATEDARHESRTARRRGRERRRQRAHNALLAAVASTVAAATPAASAAGARSDALATGSQLHAHRAGAAHRCPAGQVEVLEFFWYACPHCYDIDPQVEAWRKSKPAYISFSRVPVTWSEGHRALARLFYTLKSLGKLDQLHGEVFKEIHVNGDPLVAADRRRGRDGAHRRRRSRRRKAFPRTSSRRRITRSPWMPTYRRPMRSCSATGSTACRAS